jgi:hypothetical protein
LTVVPSRIGSKSYCTPSSDAFVVDP